MRRPFMPVVLGLMFVLPVVNTVPALPSRTPQIHDYLEPYATGQTEQSHPQ